MAALHRWGRLVLRDEEDSVHQMRVTARRLRSVLATHRPLVDPERAEPARQELKWLGDLLGEVRDAEVLHERLRHWSAEHGPAPSGIDALRAALAKRRADGREQLVPELDGERYRALVAGLAVSDGFPWSEGPPSDKTLRRRVRHDWRDLVAAVDTAVGTKNTGRRRERLHEARKRAKRTRYAAEALRGAHSKDAERLIRATRSIQSTLGDLNDAVVMIGAIDARPQHDEPLRRLRRAEDVAAHAAEKRFAPVWKKASRPKVFGWLD